MNHRCVASAAILLKLSTPFQCNLALREYGTTSEVSATPSPGHVTPPSLPPSIDNYVHRLVQNKGDGKLVEVTGQTDAPTNDEKIDSLQLEVKIEALSCCSCVVLAAVYIFADQPVGVTTPVL